MAAYMVSFTWELLSVERIKIFKILDSGVIDPADLHQALKSAAEGTFPPAEDSCTDEVGLAVYRLLNCINANTHQNQIQWAQTQTLRRLKNKFLRQRPKSPSSPTPTLTP